MVALVADSTDLLRPEEVTVILGVSMATLDRWTKDGKIPVVRVGAHGWRRYRRSDVEALLRPSRAG